MAWRVWAFLRAQPGSGRVSLAHGMTHESRDSPTAISVRASRSRPLSNRLLLSAVGALAARPDARIPVNHSIEGFRVIRAGYLDRGIDRRRAANRTGMGRGEPAAAPARPAGGPAAGDSRAPGPLLPALRRRSGSATVCEKRAPHAGLRARIRMKAVPPERAARHAASSVVSPNASRIEAHHVLASHSRRTLLQESPRRRAAF
jgi:hypothetical protein